ncbi:MAG: phosphonoacetaldehyde hydrolase [Rhizobiales bacterium]|nr:phosphonoacetaldehyde hydrolase [Hyphomicrobiales bacterium]
MSTTTPSVPERFPILALWGCAALVAAALVIASSARLTGYGRTTVPISQPAQSRSLVFTDTADGGILVAEGGSGAGVRTIPARKRGFVRVVMRGLAAQRKRIGADASLPFELTRWQDGRLSISDPATGESIELRAFGLPNERAFAELMEDTGG